MLVSKLHEIALSRAKEEPAPASFPGVVFMLYQNDLWFASTKFALPDVYGMALVNWPVPELSRSLRLGGWLPGSFIADDQEVRFIRNAGHQPLDLMDAVEFVINRAGDGQARAHRFEHGGQIGILKVLKENAGGCPCDHQPDESLRRFFGIRPNLGLVFLAGEPWGVQCGLRDS